MSVKLLPTRPVSRPRSSLQELSFVHFTCCEGPACERAFLPCCVMPVRTHLHRVRSRRLREDDRQPRLAAGSIQLGPVLGRDGDVSRPVDQQASPTSPEIHQDRRVVCIGAATVALRLHYSRSHNRLRDLCK